jgi:hypothetical protein
VSERLTPIPEGTYAAMAENPAACKNFLLFIISLLILVFGNYPVSVKLGVINNFLFEVNIFCFDSELFGENEHI